MSHRIFRTGNSAFSRCHFQTRCVDIVCWFETGQSADRVIYGDTFGPGSLEREGDQCSLEARTRRCRRRVEKQCSSSNPIVLGSREVLSTGFFTQVCKSSDTVGCISVCKTSENRSLAVHESSPLTDHDAQAIRRFPLYSLKDSNRRARYNKFHGSDGNSSQYLSFFRYLQNDCRKSKSPHESCPQSRKVHPGVAGWKARAVAVGHLGELLITHHAPSLTCLQLVSVGGLSEYAYQAKSPSPSSKCIAFPSEPSNMPSKPRFDALGKL
ncbi:hypothetical protein J6590_041584 [Homalodisca vitripennis]|nr:hypothetical protein J6590_041584 [Homalodisca vitripennis]